MRPPVFALPLAIAVALWAAAPAVRAQQPPAVEQTASDVDPDAPADAQEPAAMPTDAETPEDAPTEAVAPETPPEPSEAVDAAAADEDGPRVPAPLGVSRRADPFDAIDDAHAPAASSGRPQPGAVICLAGCDGPRGSVVGRSRTLR